MGSPGSTVCARGAAHEYRSSPLARSAASGSAVFYEDTRHRSSPSFRSRWRPTTPKPHARASASGSDALRKTERHTGTIVFMNRLVRPDSHSTHMYRDAPDPAFTVSASRSSPARRSARAVQDRSSIALNPPKLKTPHVFSISMRALRVQFRTRVPRSATPAVPAARSRGLLTLCQGDFRPACPLAQPRHRRHRGFLREHDRRGARPNADCVAAAGAPPDRTIETCRPRSRAWRPGTSASRSSATIRAIRSHPGFREQYDPRALGPSGLPSVAPTNTGAGSSSW